MGQDSRVEPRSFSLVACLQPSRNKLGHSVAQMDSYYYSICSDLDAEDPRPRLDGGVQFTDRIKGRRTGIERAIQVPC